MSSRPRQPQPKARDGELPEEFALRRLVAKARLQQARAVLKKGRASTYAGADRGRRNKDWRANNGSADLAIIPDSLTLLARCRQLVRDSWIARSIQKAYTRNVVGKEIMVTPHAKDRDGKPLAVLNRVAQAGFHHWCKTAVACDVERRKTFGQMQRLATDEQVPAGEHLWMWSYRVPLGSDGQIDRSRPVGLQFQAFEPEQFDLRVLTYEGREVRGGVEVDENGAPLAFHLYTRNPNDLLYRHAFLSERIPRERMFHYFKQERVLQTRGVPRLTPVMQDIRDLERIRGGVLTRVLMEACIGVIIKTMMPVQNIPGVQSNTLVPSADDPGQTPSGMVESDMVPGMVANLQPGEDVQSFIPQSPGNQYTPFVEHSVQGIGAGVGMSGGQVTRKSDGNYSAARQDMLEDRKELEPEQELIIDCLVRPAYELWFNFAAMEGRFDDVEGFSMEEFLAERHRFVEADYIPPPQTWIDPEKEASAFAILLKNRLITREEIVAMRGGRFYQIIQKLADERAATDEAHLSLPEDDDNRTEIRELIKAALSNRLGTIDNVTANATDIPTMIEEAGLPRRKYEQPELPVTVPASPAGPGVPVGAAPAPSGNGHANGNGNGAAKKPRLSRLDGIETAHVASDFVEDAAPSSVPNYQRSPEPMRSCATCSSSSGSRCSLYNFIFDPAKVCDSWAARTLTDNVGVPNTGKAFPPNAQPGQPDLERRFFPQADTVQPLPQFAGTAAKAEE